MEAQLATEPTISPVDAAPEPAPTTPFLVDMPGAQDEPPRRGRPPGKKKRVTTPDHGKTPPPPFAGGPPTPTGQDVSIQAVAQELVEADPEMAAGILTAAIDGAVTAVAKWRYGNAGKSLSLENDEKAREQIHKALLAYMKAASVKMTPGQAVAFAIAGAYAPKVFALEMERAQNAKAPE